MRIDCNRDLVNINDEFNPRFFIVKRGDFSNIYRNFYVFIFINFSNDTIDKEVTLSFEIQKESYSGSIRNISIGNGKNAVTIGGETCYPFYQFEGEMPNKPKIAMEIWDIQPEDWPATALAPFKDVASDPVAWAKKCVNEFGADMVVLQLKSTDPNGKNATAEEAASMVKKVSDAIKVPLIVWGTANVQKDEEVLKKISEVCQGKNITMGPVDEKNHKGIGASAMGYGHTIISSSPIDVNLAKQINILLENLGMPLERIIVDPTTGGLGYGMEYSYSVMERLRMAALNQGDDKLQYPLINNIGNEVWKCKEAKQTVEDAPTLGDPEKRGILMESVAAVAYLMAGADILILRHPETVRMVKAFIDGAMKGGMVNDVAGIKKKLPDIDVDFAALAPKPNLTITEEKTKAKAPEKKTATPKTEAKAPEKKAAPKDEKPVAKAEAKGEKKAEPKASAEEKKKSDVEAKAKAEADTKAAAEAKAAADARAREEAEVKAKAEAVAKAKAVAEAEVKGAADAKSAREAQESSIREQRAKEREARLSKKEGVSEATISMTATAQQKSEIDRIIERLNRIHRRAS